jgi:hypothetical protein
VGEKRKKRREIKAWEFIFTPWTDRRNKNVSSESKYCLVDIAIVVVY